MRIGFAKILDKYKFTPKGILHIGAHLGEEALEYDNAGIKNVVWIEGNSNLIMDLTKNISPYKQQKAYNLLVADVDNQEVNFNLTNNNSLSSSLLELDDHKLYYNDVYVTEKVKLKTKRIDTFFKEKELSPDQFDFINIDLQGAEILALNGAGSILDGIQCIYTEINLTHLYKNGALLHEMDFFLFKKGFVRVETKMTKWNFGDAFYIRRNSSKITLLLNMAQSYIWESYAHIKKCIFYFENLKKSTKGLIKNILKSNVKVYTLLKSIVNAFGYHSYKIKKAYKNYKVDVKWQSRINDVLSCPDSDYIPRVSESGVIKGGVQIMHNGVKINLGSYYTFGVTEMLRLSRGIHEPQEERVFMEVLKQMPENAVMIELGSYWAFYSMWFYNSVKRAVCYMIEPDKNGLDSGKKNFKLNNMKGHFTSAFVSSKSSKNGNDTPAVCIDDFVSTNHIPFIHILHSDIQGHELEMLHGSRKTIKENKIGYLFISTHSNELHSQCITFLKENHFVILASANLDDSYSVDGLIVARASYFKGIDPVNIALKTNNP